MTNKWRPNSSETARLHIHIRYTICMPYIHTLVTSLYTYRISFLNSSHHPFLIRAAWLQMCRRNLLSLSLSRSLDRVQSQAEDLLNLKTTVVEQSFSCCPVAAATSGADGGAEWPEEVRRELVLLYECDHTSYIYSCYFSLSSIYFPKSE